MPFGRSMGCCPLVVCSRIADYERRHCGCGSRRALSCSPSRRASRCLSDSDRSALAAVRQALHEDPIALGTIDTPLMLTIMTLAYAGESAERSVQRDPRGATAALFAVYVKRMFRRRRLSPATPAQQTERWLAWLAWQMDAAQPDCLLSRADATRLAPTGAALGADQG